MKGSWLGLVVMVLAVAAWMVVWHVGVLGTAAQKDRDGWLPPNIQTLQFPIGNPVSLTKGDFNADGSTDLFMITDANRPDWFRGIPSKDYEIRFYVLMGEGKGWKDPVQVGSWPAPGLVLYLDALTEGVDLDGDGNEDVVVLLTFYPVVKPPQMLDLNNQENHLFVFWGRGDGTFTMEHVMDVDVGMIPPSIIAAADFTGDGRLDLAWNDPQRGEIQVFYNLGDRKFDGPHAVKVYEDKDSCFPLPLTFASGRFDERRIGKELVVLGTCVYGTNDFGQFMRVLSPCGQGCWERSPLLLTKGRTSDLLQAESTRLLIRDFDGDGHTDLLYGTLFGVEQPKELGEKGKELMAVYLRKGDGQGGFAAPQLVGEVESGSLLSAEQRPDGWEILLASFSGELVVEEVKEDGTGTSTSIPVRGDAITAVLVDQNKVVIVSSPNTGKEVTWLNVITRRTP